MSDELPHYAAIVDSYSEAELKLAVLRAIDHARKTSAEIDEYRARLDGALGTLAALREENSQLKVRLTELETTK
jgi:hypothetical protein